MGEQAESLQDGRVDPGQLARHTAFALVVGVGEAAPVDFDVKATLTALVLGFGFKGGEIFGWAALPFLLIAVAAAYAGSYDVGAFGGGAASDLARVRRKARRGESILEEAR